MKVEFFKHNIDDGDIANVSEALKGTFLTTGEWVGRLEGELAAYAQRRFAVGVTSGTAAIHLALAAAGVGPGDEVITTPLTFVATANAIIMTGATPVFVDVEPDTGNIDASRIGDALSSRTKAILPVHLYGVMCDMKAIKSLADKHGLVVVEDAAHALEARRDGVAPGALSSAAALSFYATKSITSGEGGAIITDDEGIKQRATVMRLHGLSKSASERYAGVYRHYDMEVFGWKYNMSNIQAALLTGQLARVESMRSRREKIYHAYREKLAGAHGVGFPAIGDDVKSGFHLFTIWVDPMRRDEILTALSARGVGVTVNYRPVHLTRYYSETYGFRVGDFPIAERIGASTISLPFYTKLQDDELDFVVKSVRDAVA